MPGVISKIKKGVINTASDIISAPAQYRSYRKRKQADYDVKVLKQARQDRQAGYRYNPNEGDHTDPKFRTAVEAIHVRDRLMRKVK